MIRDQYSPLEIGRQLMLVREKAGLKQADLAKRVSLSQSALSRAECGDRQISTEEAKDILEQIGTADARWLAVALERNWETLPCPPLNHADGDLLWDAENAAMALIDLKDRPGTPYAFERRIWEYLEELKRAAALILKREHQIAFIGSIGVGKSTTLCRLLNLQDDESKLPVLEVGGGGTTICEVHIRTGPGLGLLVEPRTEADIRHDVEDLADQILGGPEDGTTPNADSQGTSKEVSRAIRNMASLAVQRTKTSEGKRTINDPLRELAAEFSNRRDFIIEILSRMELHQRDQRDIWYTPTCGRPSMVWLRETFSEINNGLSKAFTLPKRIEVVVPTPLLNLGDLTVRLIDTKGIDRTSARDDLEYHFDDVHTIIVLCSNFNNAPAAEIRLLIERAKEAGQRNLQTNVAILVLPRSGEALAMKDDATGVRAENDSEGYELKQEQVAMSLASLRLDEIGLTFFNAFQDSPADLESFLVQRISLLRDGFRGRLRTVIDGARALAVNHGEERVRAVVRHASESIHAWVTRSEKMKPIQSRIQESLMAQFQVAYASTVRASIRRQGEWPHLNYVHHIGYGARRLAYVALGKHISELRGHCKILLDTPRYDDAKELITQALRVLENSYEELLRKVQLGGQALFREALQSDSMLWQECLREWGTGPGYKQRVEAHNRVWFENETRRQLERQLIALIEREWLKALQSVTSLLDLSSVPTSLRAIS